MQTVMSSIPTHSLSPRVSQQKWIETNRKREPRKAGLVFTLPHLFNCAIDLKELINHSLEDENVWEHGKYEIPPTQSRRNKVHGKKACACPAVPVIPFQPRRRGRSMRSMVGQVATSQREGGDVRKSR